MDKYEAIFLGVVALLVAAVSYTYGKSRAPIKPAPTPPGPSPVQTKEDQKVTEALERAHKLKDEAEKLAGDEKQQALDKMHAAIIEDSRKLADDPDALNDYLLKVGQEIRGG